MVDDLTFQLQSWSHFSAVHAEFSIEDDKSLNFLCVGDGFGVGLIDACLDSLAEVRALDSVFDGSGIGAVWLDEVDDFIGKHTRRLGLEGQQTTKVLLLIANHHYLRVDRRSSGDFVFDQDRSYILTTSSDKELLDPASD